MSKLNLSDNQASGNQNPVSLNDLSNSEFAVERNFTPLMPDTSKPLPKYLYTVQMVVGRLMYWWRSLFGFGRTRYYLSERFQRARVIKLLSYEKGMYKGYLEDLIDATFVNSNEGQQLKKWAKIFPIVEYICDQVAMSFKNGVIITANNKKEQQLYDKIVDEIQLDGLMKQIERLVFLVKTVFVKVGYDQEKGCIKVWTVTPEKVEAEVDPEDVTKLTRITYALTDLNPYWYTQSIMVMAPLISGLPMRLASWTKEDFYVLDATGNKIYNDENTNNVNPYGVIPFVRFRETSQYDTNYIQWPGDSLENMQDSINLLATELQYLFSMQSFSIPVLINPDKEMFDPKTGKQTFQISPGKPIIFTQKDQASTPPDFKFVTPTAKFEELQKSLDRTIEQILSMYGVNVADMIPSSQKTSGKAMDNASRLLEERRDKVKLMYAQGIEELFEIIRLVWNTYNPHSQLSEAGVTVEIADSDVLQQTADDQIKMVDFRLTHGFSNLADELVKISDDMTFDEALSAIKMNISVNKQFGIPMFNSMGGNQSQTPQQPSLFGKLLGSVSGRSTSTQSLSGQAGGAGGVSTPTGKPNEGKVGGTEEKYGYIPFNSQ